MIKDSSQVQSVDLVVSCLFKRFLDNRSRNDGQIILNGLHQIYLTNNFQYLALMILLCSSQTGPNLSKKQKIEKEIRVITSTLMTDLSICVFLPTLKRKSLYISLPNAQPASYCDSSEMNLVNLVILPRQTFTHIPGLKKH